MKINNTLVFLMLLAWMVISQATVFASGITSSGTISIKTSNGWNRIVLINPYKAGVLTSRVFSLIEYRKSVSPMKEMVFVCYPSASNGDLYDPTDVDGVNVWDKKNGRYLIWYGCLEALNTGIISLMNGFFLTPDKKSL